MEIEIHQLPHSLKIRPNQLTQIARQVAEEIGLQALSVAFIFVDDRYLADIHKRYLNDSSKTDVITFNLGDDVIEGEIYISFERAVEQAQSFKVTVQEEIIRLLIHGLLHLAGYDDQQEEERVKMKTIENNLLSRHLVNC